jgi:hypothetical protein
MPSKGTLRSETRQKILKGKPATGICLVFNWENRIWVSGTGNDRKLEQGIPL